MWMEVLTPQRLAQPSPSLATALEHLYFPPSAKRTSLKCTGDNLHDKKTT